MFSYLKKKIFMIVVVAITHKPFGFDSNNMNCTYTHTNENTQEHTSTFYNVCYKSWKRH